MRCCTSDSGMIQQETHQHPLQYYCYFGGFYTWFYWAHLLTLRPQWQSYQTVGANLCQHCGTNSARFSEWSWSSPQYTMLSLMNGLRLWISILLTDWDASSTAIRTIGLSLLPLTDFAAASSPLESTDASPFLAVMAQHCVNGWYRRTTPKCRTNNEGKRGGEPSRTMSTKPAFSCR